MSNSRFLKYFPSDKAKLLRRKHPNAYLLLSLIAENARVFEGMPDGLIPGDAILGDYEAAGLTRQKYRTALDKLESFGIIEKVHNGKKLLLDRKLTIKITIGSTLVNLKESDIWDVNKILCNQPINQRATNEQPTSNHKQERIRKNKNEKESHHPNPSSKVANPDDDNRTDELSSKRKRKEPQIEVVPGIFMSQSDLDACIALKGTLENVQHAIGYIQRCPGRREKIINWPNTIARWNFKPDIKPRIIENEEMAKRYAKIYEDFGESGWRCNIEHDRIKDQKGLSFECSNAHVAPIFIPFIDQEFKNKASKVLREKKMQRARLPNS